MAWSLRVAVVCLLHLVPCAHAATRLAISGGTIDVEFAPGNTDADRGRILDWVQSSARAVTAYYGRFPASSTRLLIVPKAGDGISGGRTWAHRGAMIRIRVGAAATESDFDEDWVLVHEMTHLALPSLPDRHEWLEEGLATYVEAIARAQAGELDAEAVWKGFMDGMPNGLPGPGDRGLDRTHTWGRTYWGGAMFCLLAEVEIRRRTDNRRGLQDALRAILAEGNMETVATIESLLEIGDRAVGAPVLTELYGRMKDRPAPTDLEVMWRRLGIERNGRTVRFNDEAPDAEIRRAVTRPRA